MRKALLTYVGEPFNPACSGSKPIVWASQTLISCLLAYFIPFIVGLRGSNFPSKTQISAGYDVFTRSIPSSKILFNSIDFLSTFSNFWVYVTCGISKNCAIQGPVCAVSPSTANCPQTIKSKSGSSVFIAAEIVFPVA